MTRTAAIWAAVRLTLAGFLILLREPPLELSPAGAVLVTGVVTCLGWLEARRRNEELVLLNLGVGRAAVFLVGALPPFAAELAMGALQRL